MSAPYLHYAWQLSYFSGKSRSYLRYKDIPFVEKGIDFYTYTVRAKKRTGAAVMPVVVTPEGEWLQDTSVIIDRLEQRHPQTPVIPATPRQRLAAYLLELWGDEWWLPVAMDTRWSHPENYVLFEHDAGKGLLPRFPWFLQRRLAARAAGMMRAHLPGLGVVPAQFEVLRAWTRQALDALDAHFARLPFLLGGKPSLGDFGLIGPLYAHLGRDPWSKRELIDPRRHLSAWVGRMNQPQPRTGEFLPGDEIPATLLPLLRQMLREMTPWLHANAAELRRALPQLAPGERLRRGLGEIEFPMGAGRYRRLAIPYTLWMAQRLLDVQRRSPGAEQAATRDWLRELGGEALLDLDIPRLRREGLRVALERT